MWSEKTIGEWEVIRASKGSRLKARAGLRHSISRPDIVIRVPDQ